MPEVKPQLEKIVTKTYFCCAKCNKKMESIDITSGGLFGIGTTKAMYCDNNSCERYGSLTVAGIRTEEH